MKIKTRKTIFIVLLILAVATVIGDILESDWVFAAGNTFFFGGLLVLLYLDLKSQTKGKKQ
jgi:hypothetical protein